MVVPTLNERGNVETLVARLDAALVGIAWQAIFVDDDSADGTAAAIKAMAAADPRLQCLRRVGRRGLAGAVIEGTLASAAPFVGVIDGDLQHDETLLPAMLAPLRAGEVDLVIGSRFLRPDDLARGLTPLRRAGSRLATRLAGRVLKSDVTDPVSGFFMFRRALVEDVAPSLSAQGFKILFDIIASQPAPIRVLELPYVFAERTSGASKLDARVVVDYLGLVLNKVSHGLFSPRAVMFFLVGLSGLAVHLACLYGLKGVGAPFVLAQTLAAISAMTSNFLLNNSVTYRDRRLHGWAMARGYLRFCIFCCIGLTANIAVAELVHRALGPWILAGVAGAAMGAAWNYVSTSRAVW